MTSWARLTWQAADPAALAADLERRLGASARAHPLLAGAWVLDLGGTDLEVVPWRREAADDEPHPGGRLVFEPVELVSGGEVGGGVAPGEAGGGVAPGAVTSGGSVDPRGPVARDGAAGGDGTAIQVTPGMRLVGVAWATVELDRAERELDPWLDPAGVPGDGTEPHLGARTRTRPSPGLPARSLVLAEPSSEGRLAASLACDGEGPCALYLEPAEGLEAWLATAARRGVAVSAIRSGPFGPSAIVDGVPSGPHLVVVARGLTSPPSSPLAAGGTIA